MKKILFIFFFLFPLTLLSQSFKISPIPLKIGPGIDNYYEFSAEYKDVGIHYFHALNNRHWIVNTWWQDGYVGQTFSTFGVSYSPINLWGIFQIGAIVTHKKFPVSKATRLNFVVDIGKSFDNARISLTHISNGFGIISKVNPGYHSISVRFFL